jgi:hypothetical protein
MGGTGRNQQAISCVDLVQSNAGFGQSRSLENIQGITFLAFGFVYKKIVSLPDAKING